MDLRGRWHDFVQGSKGLLDRMRSSEGALLSAVELHILRVQLRLLDNQTRTMQQILETRSLAPPSKRQDIKILIIDPHDEDRRYWAGQLKKLSPRSVVLEARDGQTGLQLCKSEPVHCIVLELDLPDTSGISLLLKLFSRRPHPELAVVVLTHLALESLFPLAVQSGAYGCFVKSQTTVEALDQAIRKAIAGVDADKNIPLS